MKFLDLNLPKPLLGVLKSLKLDVTTVLQEQVIPIAMNRRDLLGIVQAGLGKTTAFGLPLMSRLLRAPNRIGLILTPTREQGERILEVISELTALLPDLAPALVATGDGMLAEIKALRAKPRVIIATPDRLVDHLKQGTVSLSQVEVFIVDGADRMLELAFASQLQHILRFLPKTRQTLLFARAKPSAVRSLGSKFLKNPVAIEVPEKSELKTAKAPKELKDPKDPKEAKLAVNLPKKTVESAKQKPKASLKSSLAGTTKKKSPLLSRPLNSDHKSVISLLPSMSQTLLSSKATSLSHKTP